MIKIGIVGCGWILRSHLDGYKALREAGYDNFRITALAARKEEDALRHLCRGEGPPPKGPILDSRWPDVRPHQSRCMIYVYKKADISGTAWIRHLVDDRFGSHVGTQLIELESSRIGIISHSWRGERNYVHLWEPY
ncbi:hypothetical protein ACFL6S_05235 [Candidatus Poribacteria bacterium]